MCANRNGVSIQDDIFFPADLIGGRTECKAGQAGGKNAGHVPSAHTHAGHDVGIEGEQGDPLSTGSAQAGRVSVCTLHNSPI